MPKQSFRDLLNFKAVTPIVDPSKESKSSYQPKLKTAEEDVRLKDDTKELTIRVAPNDFSQNRLSHIGKTVGAHLTQKEIDEMNNWWGLKYTDAYKEIKPVIDSAGTVGSIINSVLGNSKNAYRFIKEITDDPFGNKWHEAVKNDREETLIAAVKKHIDAFRSDWKSIKNLKNAFKKNKETGEPEVSLWDPYTYKDYTNRDLSIRDYNDFQDLLQLQSMTMPMSTSEVKTLGKEVKNLVGKAKSEATSKKRGTLIFNKEQIKSAIFDTDDEVLGWHIREFAIDSKVKDSIHRRYNNESQYYHSMSSPYFTTFNINSPKDALDYANAMGFCNGYKDVAGFSLDSSHLWGITIEPYVFSGFYNSLTPPLPKYIIPTWTITDGHYVQNESYLDYGAIPPVVSYSLNIGTSMEKDITLMNGGSFKIPVGFSYNYSLMLTFADDQHASIKNYMMYYYNTIFRPEEGLMAPYELASFLITITSFKPGLKVKNQLKLICVPVGYSVSQGGDSNPNGEMVQVGFSVVGMKTSSNYLSKVDHTLGGIWNKLTWNDIIMRPVNNNPRTGTPKYKDWGKYDNWERRRLNQYYGSDLVGRDKINTSTEKLPAGIEIPNPESDPYGLNEDPKMKRLVEKGKIERARSYAQKKINKNS